MNQQQPDLGVQRIVEMLTKEQPGVPPLSVGQIADFLHFLDAARTDFPDANPRQHLVAASGALLGLVAMRLASLGNGSFLPTLSNAMIAATAEVRLTMTKHVDLDATRSFDAMLALFLQHIIFCPKPRKMAPCRRPDNEGCVPENFPSQGHENQASIRGRCVVSASSA